MNLFDACTHVHIDGCFSKRIKTRMTNVRVFAYIFPTIITILIFKLHLYDLQFISNTMQQYIFYTNKVNVMAVCVSPTVSPRNKK